MENNYQIYLSEVIALYNESGMSNKSENFSVRYVYEDKNQEAVIKDYKVCRRRTAKTYDRSRKKTERDSGVKEKESAMFNIEFFNNGTWNVRNLYISQCTHFNNKLIDHRF